MGEVFFKKVEKIYNLDCAQYSYLSTRGRRGTTYLLKTVFNSKITLPVKNDYLETAMLALTDSAMKTVA